MASQFNVGMLCNVGAAILASVAAFVADNWDGFTSAIKIAVDGLYEVGSLVYNATSKLFSVFSGPKKLEGGDPGINFEQRDKEQYCQAMLDGPDNGKIYIWNGPCTRGGDFSGLCPI